ncbi:MAG: hypothetical protein ABIH22_02145 [Candidatus Margulisiibacteriota bacterium]
MLRANHYLIAEKPLRANVRWNGQALRPALQRALVKVASWQELDAESEALFQGFGPSGRRSYVCVLKEPIETPTGQHSAIKLKAVGKTDPVDPQFPSTQRYDIDPHSVVIGEDGAISVEALNIQPLFGRTAERVSAENRFMQLANERKLPAPYALGEGEYSDLNFDLQILGFSIMAIKDLETDNRRLGNIFQVNYSDPGGHLQRLASTFFPGRPAQESLEYLFYAAGRVQRQYNDNGLITNDCHAGNFALTSDAQAVLNDFASGKDKAWLSAPQIATYQLLDLNRFIYSVFILKGWSVGESLLSGAYPVSAYLEGYFGQEVFSRHKGVETPERLLRAPKTGPGKNNFMASVAIKKYSWTRLYDPLQEVLAEEGNEYPLSEQERIARHVEMYRSFFRSQGSRE